MTQKEDANTGESELNIHNIYIIVDGVVVFHRMYGSIEKDSALVSSFLGAMVSLSREISGQGVLKTIEIPPMRIDALQVMDSPQVLVAAATSQGFPEFAVNKILNNVAEVFLNRYADKIVTVGMRDLTDAMKGDVHKAIIAGVKEAALPYDPTNPNHRRRALPQGHTSMKYSCPHYDLKLNSKCKLDPNTFRVADCQGLAFSKGMPCPFATREDDGKEGQQGS
ncbi:MAG: hypothetical protein WED04_11435 [Promethearchaeati archaeon SRVP18_Atabeyarchaeia-1]